jgi:hypothetical protein
LKSLEVISWANIKQSTVSAGLTQIRALFASVPDVGSDFFASPPKIICMYVYIHAYTHAYYSNKSKNKIVIITYLKYDIVI